MKIAIIGIGGIGGYIGSKLCKLIGQVPGLEIVFVQRGEHLKAIQDHGLTYITKTETTVHPSLAAGTCMGAGLFDLVIFTVKSRDLEDAALSVRGNVHEETILLTTLNGVNNARRLQDMYPALRVLNGCIYVSATIERPGVVRQTGGAGSLFFGPEDGNIEPFRGLEALLKQADIKAVLSNHIARDVWSKYIFICSWASISSKHKLTAGALLQDNSIVDEWKQLLCEIRDVALAFNVELDADVVESCLGRARLLPYENKTSMQIDIENGKQPEVDIFAGFVSQAGKERGVPTPAHDAVLQALGY